MRLHLDTSLEDAVAELVATCSPAELDDYAALAFATPGSRDPSDLGEALVELLGLPLDDAHRAGARRRALLGAGRVEALVARLASELSSRGVQLAPEHLAALTGAR